MRPYVAPRRLLRSGIARSVFVLVLFGGGLVAVGAGAVASLTEESAIGLAPAVLGAVLLLAVPFAGWAIEVGRWGREYGVFQQVASAALVLAYAGFAVYCAVTGVDAYTTRATLGTPPEQAVYRLVGLTASLLVLATLVVSLPLPAARARPLALGLGAAVLAAAAATGLARIGPSGCGAFAFEPARWQEAIGGGRSARDGERLFDAVARCGTVAGMSRGEVRRALGRPERGGRGVWTWSGQWDQGGFGSAQPTFELRFGGPEDRVVEASSTTVWD